MRIQLASDLHLEFLSFSGFSRERLITPAENADVLVLAGDISNGARAIELFADWPVPVLYVLGNHEFYGQDFSQLRERIRDAVVGTSIRILDNDSVDFGGMRFLGATLWTDYRLSKNLSQEEAMAVAEKAIADHSSIRHGRSWFSAADALSEHEQSARWLERESAREYDGRTVVVTHHAPHPGSVHPKYAGNPVNGAFVSDLAELVPQAHLWLHGHVHDSFDYSVGGCRVVANPLGYPRNGRAAATPKDLRFENPQFQWACVLDV